MIRKGNEKPKMLRLDGTLEMLLFIMAVNGSRNERQWDETDKQMVLLSFPGGEKTGENGKKDEKG